MNKPSEMKINKWVLVGLCRYVVHTVKWLVNLVLNVDMSKGKLHKIKDTEYSVQKSRSAAYL